MQFVGQRLVDVAGQEDDDLTRTSVGDLYLTHRSHLRDSNVTGIPAGGNGICPLRYPLQLGYSRRCEDR
jgi:hypothetical protein